MLPDRVSNPGPLTYESGALPTALRSPAPLNRTRLCNSERSQYAVLYKSCLLIFVKNPTLGGFGTLTGEVGE